jgi:hypothetical protein
VVMLGSSGPSDIVSIIVGLSDLLLLFVPDLHTIIKDEDVDGTTLTFVSTISVVLHQEPT